MLIHELYGSLKTFVIVEYPSAQSRLNTSNSTHDLRYSGNVLGVQSDVTRWGGCIWLSDKYDKPPLGNIFLNNTYLTLTRRGSSNPQCPNTYDVRLVEDRAGTTRVLARLETRPMQ
jgi:hypothetical protein